MTRTLKILVTGGCGFIGTHLCTALQAQGHSVHVLDDLSTGKRENLAPGASLTIADIGSPGVLAAAMEGMDACYHLAAIASVERCTRDWTGTHRTNLSATIALLEAATSRSVPIVYASSAAVYGAGGDTPRRETDPTMPLSAYGADKLGCEQHARVAGHVHGVPTAGLRFFNVFGPGQNPASPYSGVISIFCDRLSRGLPINIFGDGHQTRDFVFVADVVEALMAAMEQASVAAPVLNVCTEEAISVNALAALVAELIGTPAETRHLPARVGEIAHSVGSRGHSQALLGLSAPTSLRRGLAATLDWLSREQPSGTRPVTDAVRAEAPTEAAI
ncbi:MAG: NAD-dependent epimerase/dehydratase family protein [Chitinophagaceae bacterium]|nr:NAD-dependent epimerase/dehydratase family protein [Rubrivivax sp.]